MDRGVGNGTTHRAVRSAGGRPYGTRSSRPHPYTPPAPLPEAPGQAKVVARVPLTHHEKLHRLAEMMGVSASKLVAQLIENVELDERGLPAWAPDPRPVDQLEIAEGDLGLSA